MCLYILVYAKEKVWKDLHKVIHSDNLWAVRLEGKVVYAYLYTGWGTVLLFLYLNFYKNIIFVIKIF